MGVVLSGANLYKANLREIDLRWTNLSEANLSEANLSRANLCFTNLTKADLRWADLRWADLRRADLSGAKNLVTTVTDSNTRVTDETLLPDNIEWTGDRFVKKPSKVVESVKSNDIWVAIQDFCR